MPAPPLPNAHGRSLLPVLRGWAKHVGPPDQHRYRLVPQMNFLEDP
ncbi:MAG TPA: hypothetical protein VG370_25005 [Chloroflexota bacterium]|nr:hypothetical protein [Chloroflexota bacterium]